MLSNCIALTLTVGLIYELRLDIKSTAMIGHNEAEPLGLNDLELRQLEDFLNTLNGPVLTPIL